MHVKDDKADETYQQIYKVTLNDPQNTLNLTEVGPKILLTGDKKCYSIYDI